jgi:hypothetical protein
MVETGLVVAFRVGVFRAIFAARKVRWDFNNSFEDVTNGHFWRFLHTFV